MLVLKGREGLFWVRAATFDHANVHILYSNLLIWDTWAAEVLCK